MHGDQDRLLSRKEFCCFAPPVETGGFSHSHARTWTLKSWKKILRSRVKSDERRCLLSRFNAQPLQTREPSKRRGPALQPSRHVFNRPGDLGFYGSHVTQKRTGIAISAKGLSNYFICEIKEKIIASREKIPDSLPWPTGSLFYNI